MTAYSGTYTFASNDTGSTKDLGTTHTYRYVNATNVYNKGKSDSQTSFSLYRISKVSGKNFTVPTTQLSGKSVMYFVIIYEAYNNGRVLGAEPNVSSGTKTKLLHVMDSDSDNYTFDVYKVIGFSTSATFTITLNTRNNDGTWVGCALLN